MPIEARIVPTSVVAEHIENAPYSATGAMELARVFGLTGDLTGKKILDIGASQSDFCAYLLSQGADAYAIDPRYAKPEILGQKEDEAIKELKAMTIHPLISPVKVYQLAEDLRERAKVFKASLNQNPGRYIPASFHALPFADETFDDVTSSYAITGVASRNPQLLQAAFCEALRVTKPGGRLQLYPVTYAPGLDADENRNIAKLLTPLYGDPSVRLSFEKFRVADHDIGRLAIEKVNK